MSVLSSVPGSNPGSHIALSVHSLLELHDAVFLFKIYLFLFLAVLGLPYCPQAFSSCTDWEYFPSNVQASHCGGSLIVAWD